MSCPPGFTLATISVHQRNPEGTAVLSVCAQP